MARRITQKDAGQAIAMLAKAPAVVNEDGTPTQETIDMLQNNGHAMTQDELRTGDVTTMVAADVAKARVQDREDAIKAKQDSERSATKAAAVKASKAPAKKAGTTRAKKVAAPKVATPKATGPKTTPKAKDATPSKAQRVRDLLDQGKTVNDVAKALDDVTWSYAWDVAAAWEKKTGKTVIPSHVAKTAPKSTRRTTTAKATVAK